MTHAEKAEKLRSFVTKSKAENEFESSWLGDAVGKKVFNMPRTLTGRSKLYVIGEVNGAVTGALLYNFSAPACSRQSGMHRQVHAHFPLLISLMVKLHCTDNGASRDSHQYSSSSSVIDWLWL